MKTVNEPNKTSKKSPSPTNFYENYDAQLSEWSQNLTEYKEKLTQLSSDLQMEATQKIENLQEKYLEASNRMKELKSKGSHAKDEAKIGFEKAWKELLHAFNAAKKSFH